MTTVPPFASASDLTATDYLVVGAATCFIKQDGEVHPVEIIEPIPSAALEAIVKGIPTSYQRICGITLADLAQGETLGLPPGFDASTQFCDEFVSRAIAAARTYKSRPKAQTLVPTGTTRTDLNYSLDRKRVLNSERIVKTEDNVKQHAYTHQVL